MVESENEEINQVGNEPEQNVVSDEAFVVAPAEQDLAAMSKETGTAMFSYADIHNAKVDNELNAKKNQIEIEQTATKNALNKDFGAEDYILKIITCK